MFFGLLLALLAFVMFSYFLLLILVQGVDLKRLH